MPSKTQKFTEPTTWLTLNQAAEHAAASTRTVRRWIAEGKLPAYRAAGKASVRVKLADVDALFTPIPTVGTMGGAA